MKHSVDLIPVEACNQPTRVLCGEGSEVYAPTTSLLQNLGHDRQRAIGAGADDQPASAPGELLVSRQRGMPELIAVRLRRLLLRFRTRPPSRTTPLSYSRPSTSIDPNRSSRTCIPSPPGGSAAGELAPLAVGLLFMIPTSCEPATLGVASASTRPSASSRRQRGSRGPAHGIVR